MDFFSNQALTDPQDLYKNFHNLLGFVTTFVQAITVFANFFKRKKTCTLFFMKA